MENAKFRVVEFEESDVLTASGNTAPGTGSRVMHVQVTSSGTEVSGIAGYMYEDGTWQVVGDFYYSNSNMAVAPGCYAFPNGLYRNWHGGYNDVMSTNWDDMLGEWDSLQTGKYSSSFGYETGITNLLGDGPHTVHN